ncbi:MAG: hypothetical protein QNJ32_25375 [Xenococcaceae cyanobacterium MO_167.B27]|nr:hypothetical protein [Xenococcaceae cyanobacterium MO_167.B27]
MRLRFFYLYVNIPEFNEDWKTDRAFSRKALIGDRKYGLVLNFDVYARRKLWEHQRAGKRRYPRARPTPMTTVVTTRQQPMLSVV